MSLRFLRLLALGESRSPGSLLTAFDDASRQRLSQAVVTSEAAADHLDGYASWNGADPTPSG